MRVLVTPQYAAGFFDGEGCVLITNRKMRVILTQKHRFVLDEMQRIWGGSVHKNRHADGRYVYRLTINGESARKFLSDIAPFSICKSDQIMTALGFMEMKSRLPHYGRGNPMPEAVSTLHDAFKSCLSEMKWARAS